MNESVHRTKLYACSTNLGKLREFVLAAGPDVDLEPLPDLKSVEPPEESGVTFEENAVIKALYYSRFTSELVFADDSGLAVDALGGEPGVYSARYSGPSASDVDNNRLLLERMQGKSGRRARFVCVIALAREGKLLGTFTGVVEGEILHHPRGANGFGYDPLFFCPALGATLAEVEGAAKFAISHRGNAVRAMLASLRAG